MIKMPPAHVSLLLLRWFIRYVLLLRLGWSGMVWSGLLFCIEFSSTGAVGEVLWWITFVLVFRLGLLK